ncbi:exodeoxyribonuclease VII large subunit [Undibacterium fentianense]|uniref:Exodeoxyribonuclease 7 large subunit n=1 Tax=Undibacterium fentianense TaxID=2828728 RepID=A0A941E2V4_9BURK|nr:exodeoxyribonuclease VII large subunit [Undibacterium fentianense]MBR7799976.1 exodeoxyribonuclease VII large subunit [Undibacterium fentianense]
MSTQFFTPSIQRTDLVLSVSALNNAVAKLLEQNFPLTWIAGEISNLTRAASGHWYFTLKDGQAQVRAVMFKGRAQFASFIPREGDKVEVRALVSLYTPRGDFQINVEAIRRAGIGNLYEAFLQLKEKLEAEGLFDKKRKKSLPKFVRKVGIVTSPNAAALRDVLSALKRRAPHIEIIIYPCPVQGDGASVRIAQMIAQADNDNLCDALIVCRGGGSIEDLWAFNEEVLARTIAHCNLPIISGIGHETDFTIADFVADLRAPTPTAAAELVAISRSELLFQVSEAQVKLKKLVQRQLETHAQKLDWMTHRLRSPEASLTMKRLEISQNAKYLHNAMRKLWQTKKNQLEQYQGRWHHRRPDCKQAQLRLEHWQETLLRQMEQLKQKQHTNLRNLSEKLEMLNPQRTLERGYIILQQADGTVIRNAKQIHAEEKLQMRTASDQSEIRIAEVRLTKSML